jgi:type IV pilus assembly protein PilW
MNKRHSFRGFTLIELMISITIALFLIGGLVTLVGAMKRTTTTQSALSLLQDNERLAVSLMGSVIQSGGFFPNPINNSATGLLTVTAPFTVAGQAIYGTGAGTAVTPTDTLYVRYVTGGTAAPQYADTLMNCSGGTSTTQATFVNEFDVAVVGGVSYLQCQLKVNNNPTQTINLISGVTNMQVYYGVQTNPAWGTPSIDAYLDAPAVTAGNYWPNVLSVKVILYFTNPLYGQPGQTCATCQTIPLTTVFDVMNKTGVTS